jgi:hypothetical protein
VQLARRVVGPTDHEQAGSKWRGAPFAEITTRDVADLLHVTQATVRRRLERGSISPVGKFNPSNLFNTRDVLAAHDNIEARRKATGQGRPECRSRVQPLPSTTSTPKHPA